MKPRITVIGSLNMDMVIQIDSFPLPGQTVLGGNLDYIPGGKGANQAVAAARLKGDVALIGKVGTDAFGQVLLDNLLKNGVDVSAVKRENVSSGVALITVTPSGENQIVVSPGANSLVNADFVQEHENTIRSAQVLLLQLETPLAAVKRAVELAKEAGVLVILNPAPAQALPESLLNQVDVLTPNETELSILSGVPVQNMVEVYTASRILLEKGTKCVVTTLGDKGAFLCSPNINVLIPGYSVKAIDTTAAGDSFTAALAVAVAQGKPLPKAVKFANKVGALTVTKKGAQPSLPLLDEVEKYPFKEGSA
ncbi:MAG: ribokinase [Bacillota bacterium]|uniref:Ribokinase n=1 Tax=Thermanaerosceptrum fracticalcis TaxID=1712410 RepID=A0A7G6E5E8_THEFR|nr:ribokinase [Thermanaerosceptrum fracticalcis]QNB47302.1 ribokinase [Thermanaerosceptrum fracticalcis]